MGMALLWGDRRYEIVYITYYILYIRYLLIPTAYCMTYDTHTYIHSYIHTYIQYLKP
jgi:hypothetical protein